jgi:hypothetical protein
MKNGMFSKSRIINPFAPTKIRITIDTNITNGQSEIKSDPPIHALATLQIMIAACQGIIQKIMEMENMIVRPGAGEAENVIEKKMENQIQPDGKESDGTEKSSDNRGN